MFRIISSSFCLIVVAANLISAKMVPLPWAGFSVPAGLFIYPLTFLLSDLVTERLGAASARRMVYFSLAMNGVSLLLLEALLLFGNNDILHLGALRIFASLVAYFVSQMVDIQLYAWLKSRTNLLWLRNNGSTCISQLLDTLLIDLIYLYGGLNMSMGELLPIMLFSYLYKAFFSVATTPLFYLCLFWTRKPTNA